ncbi:MAG: CCA tRNA nucleotidyltransferase [Candidatus Woesearchaeota archaeon]|nr:CCA tRNA nucleotidyltransferase [Candidatus Woesearchaeota archaeon]
MDFLEKIKSEIRPDKSVLAEVTRSIAEINDELRKRGINASCVPGGSFAKNTFLKGDFDIDLFVKFDYSYKDKDISDILANVLRHKNERLHGSRDYFQFSKGGLNYEVVPVIDVKNPKDSLNVTDMSPMHVIWVKKKLKKGMEDEIRLLKKFCKAQGCYGAESYINGFSGHVIDILVIHYGSFLDVLKASQKWKPKVVIDTEKHYKNNVEIMFHLNQSKIQGPMILIDPILNTRNAASSLSYEKFAMFKKSASKFLKRPSEDFFEEKTITEAYLRSRFKKVCILKIKTEQGKMDIIGSKVLKAFEYLKTELKKAGFSVKDAGWYWNKKFSALYWFTFKSDMLPDIREVAGPPTDMKEACKAFKEKYKKTYEKEGKLYSEVKNEIRTARDNLAIFIDAPYFKEKVIAKEVEFFE